MAQKSFGRREVSPRSAVVPAAAGGDASEASGGRGAGRSAAILGAVLGLAALTALGLTMVLGAGAGISGADTEASPAVIQETTCRGQTGCTNQYDVKLSCGSAEEPKTVSVHAADAEAAQAKAERYNRDCRARGASFVAAFLKGSTRTAFAAPSSAEASSRVAANDTTTRRTRWRFRRR